MTKHRKPSQGPPAMYQRVIVVGVTSIVAEFIWRHRQYLLDVLVVKDNGFIAYTISSIVAYFIIMAFLFGIGSVLSKSIVAALSSKGGKSQKRLSDTKEQPKNTVAKKSETTVSVPPPPSSPEKVDQPTVAVKEAPQVQAKKPESLTTDIPAELTKAEKPLSPKAKATAPSASSEDFKEIDRVLLGNREEPGAIEKVQQQLEGMEKTGPVLARLAQITYWIGEFAETKAEKDEIFREAVELGRQAVEKAPDCFEARFWYAVSMGSHGLVKGMMQSAQYLTPLTQHAEWAYNTNPGYFQGGPCRLWGGVLLDCPPWPIGVGDKRKALKVLQQAIELGQDFPQNYLLLARAYYANGDKDNALEALRELSSQKPPATNAGFHGKMRWEAQDLIAKYSKAN